MLAVPTPEATVVVSRRGISVGGHRLVSLADDGGGLAVPEADLRGVLVTELHRRLLDDARAARADSGDFVGRVALEVDRDVPGTVLVQVTATAAAADFTKPWVVVRAQAQRRGIAVSLPTPETDEAVRSEPAKEADSPAVRVGYANPEITLDVERGFVVVARDKVVDPTGEGLVLACEPSPCLTGWPTVELNRLARRLKLDHPRDRAVVVTPTGSADVQALVGTFDATRHDATAGRGNRELFPEVILGLGAE